MQLCSLSRYADVVQALRSECLSTRSSVGDEHREVREAAFAAICPARLSRWAPRLARLGSSVDLANDVAKPWSLELAAVAAGISVSEAERLSEPASAVFNAAAEPFDTTLRENARHATIELARNFPGPLSSFHVQQFVALSQTLPSFLSNAWLALLQHPEELKKLHHDVSLLPAAMEELLRYAGPSQAILRYAHADAQIGGLSIPKGATVALMLGSANRDATHFPDPDRLDLNRKAVKHLAFGLGAHSCVGTSLVRTAAILATRAFIDQFAEAELAGYTPHERFAIRSLKTLTVVRPS